MALTSTQVTNITKLAVAMFGVAPGGYMTTLTTIFNSVNGDMNAFANALAATPAFTSASYYPNYLTTAQIATKMVNSYGLTGDAATAAQDYFVANLNAGVSIGSLFVAANDFLAANASNATYSAAAATLANKAAVAEYYTVTLAGTSTDLGVLGGAISSVTATTDVSSTTAMAAVINSSSAAATGQTFTLTTGVNNFTGTANNDTFTADETVDAVVSLADVLTGGAGTDSLTIYNSKGVVPTMTGIETVTLNTIADSKNFDFSSNTSLTSLSVISAGGTNNFTVGTGASVSLASTAIDAGADGDADINVVYDAEATSASLTLNKVTSEGADSSLGITGAKLTTLNIATTGAASTIQELEIGGNAAGNSAKIATLVVTGDKDLTITEGVDLLTAVTNTITTTGLTGALNLGTGIAALDAKQNLTFNAGNGVNTVTFVDVNVDASVTATFGTGKDVITLSDATGSVSIDTGAGNDTLTISELDSKFNATDKETAVFNLGAGDDTLAIATGLTQANLASGVTLNGGDGTDTLSILNAEFLKLYDATTDITVTGFETLKAGDAGTYNMSKVSGLTGLNLSAAAAYVITGMNATQAAAVTQTADLTSSSYALTTATGTSDVLGVTFAHATENTAMSDAMTVTGFETVNLTNNNGTGTLGLTFAAGADVTAMTLGGTGTGAATIDTANLTALTSFDASKAAGVVNLTTAATQPATFTLSAQADVVTLTASTGAATFDLGAADDTISGLQADFTALKSLIGGAGTDTMKLTNNAGSTATTTISDNTFKNITSGVEVVNIASAELGATSWTLGGYANALATANSGVLTVTATTTMGTDDADGMTINSTGLSDSNALKLTITDTAVLAAKTAAISVTNGAGNDTITITESKASSVATITVDAGAGNNTVTTTAILGATSVTTAGGTDTVKVTTAGIAASDVVIATGAGVDTITVVGTGTAGADYINKITAGTGADVIDVSSSTGTAAAFVVNKFVVAANDSTVTAYDSITGFFVETTASARKADTLDLASATVATNTAATDAGDYGTIKSHAIASGIATFDDVNTFATALTVSSSNLADVLGYLGANITDGDTVAFTYDAAADGTVDGTFVFQGNATADVLVYLVGVTGTSVATAASTAGLIGIM